VVEAAGAISTRVVTSKVRHCPGTGANTRVWSLSALAKVVKIGLAQTPIAVCKNDRRAGVMKEISGLIEKLSAFKRVKESLKTSKAVVFLVGAASELNEALKHSVCCTQPSPLLSLILSA
jgi:hypothetical protein